MVTQKRRFFLKSCLAVMGAALLAGKLRFLGRERSLTVIVPLPPGKTFADYQRDSDRWINRAAYRDGLMDLQQRKILTNVSRVEDHQLGRVVHSFRFPDKQSMATFKKFMLKDCGFNVKVKENLGYAMIGSFTDESERSFWG